MYRLILVKIQNCCNPCLLGDSVPTLSVFAGSFVLSFSLKILFTSYHECLHICEFHSLAPQTRTQNSHFSCLAASFDLGVLPEEEKHTSFSAILKTKFQRLSRTDKDAFLSDQCKEIEENNRMGKTRDLFKKITDTKRTFHAKMGSIKDRNGKNLTEAENIKKRWQKHTEELYKKDLNDLDNHDGVITHLEPDILECEVKWALGSISKNKASGGDGIPAELFQILKDDAMKVLHSICQQIWKTQQVDTGLQKGQFSLQSQRRAMQKNVQTTTQ